MKRLRLRLLFIVVTLVFGSLTTVEARALGRPGSFSLRAPAAGATISTDIPWFSWSGAFLASRYRLQIRNVQGALIVSRSYSRSDAGCMFDRSCTVRSPYRFPNGSFSWRIVASNIFGSTYTSFRTLIVRTATPEAQRLLTLVNQKRCAAKQVPLALDSRLSAAGQTHSTRMMQLNFFAHIDPHNNTSPGDRIRAAGYTATAWGENIAAGYSDVDTAFEGWWNSPGHQANIVRSYFREMGLGYARGGEYNYYWTQTFGTRTGATGGRCP